MMDKSFISVFSLFSVNEIEYLSMVGRRVRGRNSIARKKIMNQIDYQIGGFSMAYSEHNKVICYLVTIKSFAGSNFLS